MSGNGHNPDRPSGAFEDEMAEWELERSLGGFAAEMRGALLQAPDHLTAERHLRAMLAASEAAPTGPTTSPARRRPRFAALRIAAAAGAGLVLLTCGLALAGVRPPEPISDALEAVGIDVPGSDVGSPEEPRSRPADSGGGGSAGAEDAPSAGGAHADRASGQPNRARGEDRADERRSDRGEEASAEGQETAAEASSGEAPPSSPGASDASPPSDPGAPADPGPPAHSQGQGPPAQVPRGDPPVDVPRSGPPASAPGAAQSEAAQDAHGPG
jgi:hypothetical protein